MELFMRLFKEEEGQGLVEYALIIAFISLVIIAAGPTIKEALTKIFNDISTELTKAAGE